MATIEASGIEPGQRHLNGPQTTGRDYRNLSQPAHAMTRDEDVSVPMRDGVHLLADVHRLLAHYMHALFLLASAAFIAYNIAFAIMGVPYGLLLSALAGILEFIPMVGPASAAAAIPPSDRPGSSGSARRAGRSAEATAGS